jgi:hypothetical protein
MHNSHHPHIYCTSLHSSSVNNKFHTQTNKSYKLIMTIQYTVCTNTNCTIIIMLCDVRTSSSTAILHDTVGVAGNQVCTNQQLADVHVLKYKSGRLTCKHRKESLPVLYKGGTAGTVKCTRPVWLKGFTRSKGTLSHYSTVTTVQSLR